jgi:adenosylhomocysteine nucleosidase
MDVLIVTPTGREARAIGGRARIVVTGTAGAPDLLREAIAEQRPGVIVIAGFCGALDPSLRPGAIIISRMAAMAGSPELLPEKGLIDAVRDEFHRRKTTFVYSRILTTDTAIASKQRKLDVWNEYGAAGVDMETYPLAAAANDAGIPWVAVRVVVDDASQALPASLGEWREDGDEREALKQAIRRPLEWRAYGRLGLAYRSASRALPRAAAIMRAAAQQPWEADLSLPLIDVS